MKILIPIYLIAVVFSSVFLFQDSELKESMKRGREIYTDFCVTCHLQKGEGVAYTFPPLARSDYLMNEKRESIKAIKYGLQGEITVNGITYNSAMADLGLEDEEVADVMNYISNSWGNTSDSIVTEKEVASIQK
ncbi:c-type cytochrome [Maribacter antarcticus]|uniref:c-type cytochrome n=1 Tax=Maribacter antarcticus TaxID=505250 RepID=UPI000478E4F1|nr:cytochrome c [Maribacter antarcticus]